MRNDDMELGLNTVLFFRYFLFCLVVISTEVEKSVKVAVKDLSIPLRFTRDDDLSSEIVSSFLLAMTILHRINALRLSLLFYISSNTNTQSLPFAGSPGGLNSFIPLFSNSPIGMIFPVLGSNHNAFTSSPSILPI